MKKLIAAALTGALVLGTVGTSVVFAADDDKTITVAASETPHSEILEAAKPILEEEGYDLEVTVFDDYVQPNEVVESGDFDANYFQHIPYLNSFNEEKGTHLVNAGGIHYEPFGIYPGTKSSLDDIAEQLGKSKSTIKTQLLRAKKKLGVKSCRDIIRVVRTKGVVL